MLLYIFLIFRDSEYNRTIKLPAKQNALAYKYFALDSKNTKSWENLSNSEIITRFHISTDQKVYRRRDISHQGL